GRVVGDFVEQVVRDLPRLVDEQDVVWRLAVVTHSQVGGLPASLADRAELVTRRYDDLAPNRDSGGGRCDRGPRADVRRHVGEPIFGYEQADLALPQFGPERACESVGLLVGENHNADPGARRMFDRVGDELPQGV